MGTKATGNEIICATFHFSSFTYHPWAPLFSSFFAKFALDRLVLVNAKSFIVLAAFCLRDAYFCTYFFLRLQNILVLGHYNKLTLFTAKPSIYSKLAIHTHVDKRGLDQWVYRSKAMTDPDSLKAIKVDAK